MPTFVAFSVMILILHLPTSSQTSQSLVPQDNCFGVCAVRLSAILDADSQLVPTSVAVFDRKQFQNFCREVAAFRVCIKPCAKSPKGTIIESVLDGADYSCVTHYEETMKWMPCVFPIQLNSSCNESCNSQQLSSLQQLLGTLRQNNNNTGRVATVEQLLNDSCSYLICRLSCEMPRLTAECGGWSTVSLLHNLTARTFDIVRNVSEHLGLIRHWPAGCTALQTGVYLGNITHKSVKAEPEFTLEDGNSETKVKPTVFFRDASNSANKHIIPIATRWSIMLPISMFFLFETQ